jgi:DNA invertase Pin-like site-specific DNA recombinase
MKHRSLSQLLASGASISAISYARVSSEKQLRGEGLRRQRQGTLDWIAKHPELRIRLDDELTDAARSAWKGDHVEDGALGSILRQVKSSVLRPPLMLIVEHLDRLSRQNPWQAQEQLAGLVNRGILVATTKDDKIYSSESGIGDIIMSVVYMSAAHEESEKKSSRVRDTKRQYVHEAMRTKHVLHQNAPGWIRVAEAISSTNRATRRYELIDRHAATVLRIYQMGLHHGSGYICSWLIANNVPAIGRTGKWNIRHVRRILHSRAVLGHLESRHGLIENIYPPVPSLTEVLWLRVQAALKQRREAVVGGYKLGSHNNLLAGIGICTACGGKMRINTRGGRRYYECQSHVVLKNCNNRSRYRVDRVEDAVFRHLDFLEISASAATSPIDVAALAEEHTRMAARQKRLEARLQELDDDDMADSVFAQLRELRSKVKDAAIALSAAQQQSAVASAPVVLSRNADRSEIASGLKARLDAALFYPDRRVMLASKGGVVLVVPPDDTPALMFKAPDGQVAIVRDGKVHVTEKGLPDRLAPLDVRTIAEVQARLRTPP